MSLRAAESYVLSEDQKRCYAENGYIVFRGLIEPHLLDAYRWRFSELCNGNQLSASVVKEYSLVQKKTNPEDYVYKIQDILDDDIYKTYTEHARILAVVSQLIGHELTAVNLMLINKPPESARHPTHQDLFYFPFRPVDKIIGVWTAIDPTDKENGCLYIVPGSHKCRELLRHGTFKDSKKFFHSLADEDTLASVERRMHLEMNPGDTVFFHPYLFHGSGPNNTSRYRKALTIHYASKECYFIDLKDTVQEELGRQFTEEMRKKGLDGMRYEDVWKLKSKPLQRIRSHL